MTYDSNPVLLTYTEEEIKKLVADYVAKQNREFSYKSICASILQQAKEDGKVPNAEHTEYSSNELNPISGAQISKAIWELIWNKEIYIVFGKNPYGGGYSEDIRLAKYLGRIVEE